MTLETWTVGSEYDDQLLKSLGEEMRAFGYVIDLESWGVGGSQEICSWTVVGPNGALVVETETYIGLSVSGDSELVAELKARFLGN